MLIQDLERETRRGFVRGRGGRAPAEALAWNDAAWEVPWHNLVGEVSGCGSSLRGVRGGALFLLDWFARGQMGACRVIF